ncbi:MAG TPA: excinuclease ABC subunit UvrA [Clostridia bacterium]|nr:excinuclease ABC subunit UvrA [Clostridia bacterium]
MENNIIIKGARENNLKNIDIEIPRNKLVVFTGVSGSGKSSLAFDTIYAEGQMRYVESLSSYARQFLGQMGKPDVDFIEGLSPAISLDQKTTSKNPRSTVGTVTEIYDYLRLLWARIGTPHCPICGRVIRRQSVDQIVDKVLTLPLGTKFQVLAPVIRGKKGEHQRVFESVKRSGYARVRADGVLYDLSEEIKLDKNKKHNIEIVIDRLVVKQENMQRLSDSVETALSFSEGLVIIHQPVNSYEELFSQNYACAECGVSLPELSPRMFSFNNPYGACPKCAGLGFHLNVDAGLIMPDRAQSNIEEYMSASACLECHGDRLTPTILAVTVGDISISDFCKLSVSDALAFIQGLTLEGADAIIAESILKEISTRLGFLKNVGLGYLTLSRSAGTLSGGESQRIRLATQIGSGLMGVMYIFDEPSIGLHQRDNDRLIAVLKSLRDLGNTLIVVEHDEDTVRQADWIVDIGPGAGIHGGEVVAQGVLENIMAVPQSVTGQYLSGMRKIPVPIKRRIGNEHSLKIYGAAEHNLKKINVAIPLGTFTCVTGVSGSGKSSLVNEILYKKLAAELNRARMRSGRHDYMEGLEHLDKVINIDQSPIGRTPRSNPATYTGLFNDIRVLFAATNDAKVRAYSPGRFSFNVKGGRCEACAGDGLVKIEMQFMPDIFVPCDVCKGVRYNRETLEVRYKGKNISEVLEMTADEAVAFFENLPKIRRKVEAFCRVGLGYIKLGQASTTMSGGEAQRVKLAAELLKPPTGATIYILDEPTTGLHAADVHQLIDVLQALVDDGNTVVVIEHNLDVIKTADHIIDLGPEGGAEGGNIVCIGTPEQVAACTNSYTGRYLVKML